jgi:predicted kinase
MDSKTDVSDMESKTDVSDISVAPRIRTIRQDMRRLLCHGKTKKPRFLIIMRGPSGCGKSTTAKWFLEQFKKEKICVEIFSTDDYFMVDGVYTFDKRKLAEYHELNHRQAIGAMVRKVPIVIIDNTNIYEEHFNPYIISGKSYAYRIVEISAEMIRPNINRLISDSDALASICKSENRNPSRGKSVPDEVIDHQVRLYYSIGLRIGK